MYIKCFFVVEYYEEVVDVVGDGEIEVVDVVDIDFDGEVL